MTRKLWLGALAMGAVVTGTVAVATSADARDGCGAGFHRGPYGRCHPNFGPGPVVVAPGLVVGNFYAGRGYWDGYRYWGHRHPWHRGWRYY